MTCFVCGDPVNRSYCDDHRCQGFLVAQPETRCSAQRRNGSRFCWVHDWQTRLHFGDVLREIGPPR